VEKPFNIYVFENGTDSSIASGHRLHRRVFLKPIHLHVIILMESFCNSCKNNEGDEEHTGAIPHTLSQTRNKK